jgi:hypothetical protein
MARTPLILVQSCFADRVGGRQQAARETWLHRWRHWVQAYFVLGVSADIGIQGDELLLDARDDYYGTPFKTQAALKWVLRNDYRRVFHCAVVTWVNVPALLAADCWRSEYIGHRCAESDGGHASGGNGYWIGGNAMAIVAQADPVPTYEDLWVGTVLRQSGITCEHDPDYGNGNITTHTFTAEGMRKRGNEV